jgi:hypothetical protein
VDKTESRLHWFDVGVVAQLAERRNGIAKVVGATPIDSTIFGRLAEWTIASVLKTEVASATASSNPAPSAMRA